MVEMTTTLAVAKTSTRSHFGNNYNAGIMVHSITRGVVVDPRQKATKKMKLSINNSMGVISIVTTVIRRTMPDGVGQTGR